MSLSPKWRHFLENSRWHINTTIILALINLFTFIASGDSTPWFLIPVFFMSLWLVPDFIDTLLSKDKAKKPKGKGKGKTKSDYQAVTTQAEVASTKQTRNPKPVVNTIVQSHLDKAHTYKEQIDSLIKSTSNQNIHKRLHELSVQFSEWTDAIEKMALHLDQFQQNSLIRQDLESLPQSIEKLEEQLADETEETIRAELERTLANRKNQLALLDQLQNTMRQAELKLEHTLAAIGIIYSQILAAETTDQVADYSRLSDEVNEEVRRLQDHLEAWEEVKLGRYKAL